MEIFYCAFMKRGTCKHPFSESAEGNKPSGARVDFVGPGEVLLCTQAGSDDKERIVCDKKVIVSDQIRPVDNGDGSGPC